VLKLFSRPIQSITGAAIVIATAGLASRLLGVVRDRLLASTFGAGDTLDAYYAAFRIPDLLFKVIIAGALSAGFIPLFLDLYNKNEQRAWNLTNRIIHIFGSVLILVGIVLFIFTPELTRLIAPGFTGEKFDLTVHLTRLMFLSPIFLGLSSIFGSVLQARKLFLINSIAPVLYNLGIIFGIVFLVKPYGIWGVAYGVIAGAFLHFLTQVPASLKVGFKYKLLFGWRNKDLVKLVKLMIPRALTIGAYQVNTIAITMFATTLTVGSVAMFQLADNLYGVAIGLFAIPFALAAFPAFSEAAAKKDVKEFIAQLSSVTRQVLYFVIPTSFLFIVLRTEIVRIILGAGKFDWEDTILTADTLAFLAIGLFGLSLVLVFVRAFYAWQDTRTPLIAAITGSVGGIISAYYFKDLFPVWTGDPQTGVVGLAAAMSVSQILNLGFLWIMLRKKFNAQKPVVKLFSTVTKRFSGTEKSIISSLLKIIISSIVMLVVVQSLKEVIGPRVDLQTFAGVFARLVVSAFIGGAVYLGMTALLKSPEWEMFKESTHKKWMKLRVGQEIES
jgi:putative peptidoglycan lipid II flippase